MLFSNKLFQLLLICGLMTSCKVFGMDPRKPNPIEKKKEEEKAARRAVLERIERHKEERKRKRSKNNHQEEKLLDDMCRQLQTLRLKKGSDDAPRQQQIHENKERIQSLKVTVGNIKQAVEILDLEELLKDLKDENARFAKVISVLEVLAADDINPCQEQLSKVQEGDEFKEVVAELRNAIDTLSKSLEYHLSVRLGDQHHKDQINNLKGILNHIRRSCGLDEKIGEQESVETLQVVNATYKCGTFDQLPYELALLILEQCLDKKSLEQFFKSACTLKLVCKYFQKITHLSWFGTSEALKSIVQKSGFRIDEDPFPLHVALNWYEVADLYFHLKLGADVNQQDETEAQKTPLNLAIIKGCMKGIKMLIKYAADVNKPDGGCGETPLFRACSARSISSNDRLQIIALLLEKGADPNVADVGGSTPLHAIIGSYPFEKNRELASGVYIQIITLLLQHGADATKVDIEGNLPLDIARLGRNQGFIDLLEKALAEKKQ